MLAVAYVLLLNLFSGWLLPLIVSALLVHTAFWLANGNFWASLGHAAPNVKSPSPESTVRYLNQMRTRLAKQPSLTGVMIFGSLARGEWHGQSDVDLRVLRAPGLRNWLVANMLIMHERFRAFWSGQQIDVFLADGPAFLSASEEPLFLVKRDSRLDHLWPDRTSCSITEDHFRRTA